MNRRQLKRYLGDGGPSLPPSRGRPDLERGYMERVQALTGPERARKPADRPAERRPGIRRLPALARIAVVAAALLAVLAGTGFGSAYAMPGNPLYSVKRMLEGARLSLAGQGEAKAEAYLAFANRRIGELEYANDRGMKEWYLALASGADDRIAASRGEAGRLEGSDRDRHLEAAMNAEARLYGLMGRLRGQVPSEDRGRLERLRRKAREGSGGATVPKGPKPPVTPGTPGSSGSSGSPAPLESPGRRRGK